MLHAIDTLVLLSLLLNTYRLCCLFHVFFFFSALLGLSSAMKAGFNREDNWTSRVQKKCCKPFFFNNSVILPMIVYCAEWVYQMCCFNQELFAGLQTSDSSDAQDFLETGGAVGFLQQTACRPMQNWKMNHGIHMQAQQCSQLVAALVLLEHLQICRCI